MHAVARAAAAVAAAAAAAAAIAAAVAAEEKQQHENLLGVCHDAAHANELAQVKTSDPATAAAAATAAETAEAKTAANAATIQAKGSIDTAEMPNWIGSLNPSKPTEEGVELKSERNKPSSGNGCSTKKGFEVWLPQDEGGSG
ncbi:hypothetical protein ACSSS7_001844 [Eimeria intestinalis]